MQADLLVNSSTKNLRGRSFSPTPSTTCTQAQTATPSLSTDDVFEKFIGPGSVQVHPDFDRIKWVNEAYYQSLQLLRQFRLVFDELVTALLEKKQLTAEELNPILNKLPRKSPRSKLYTWSTTHKAVEALEATNPNDPRLAVYRATKRAMEINTATWKAQQAMDAAKKAHHEAEVNGKRAHQEIVYMLRNNKSLVEAKQHFLGILKDGLKVTAGAVALPTPASLGPAQLPDHASSA